MFDDKRDSSKFFNYSLWVKITCINVPTYAYIVIESVFVVVYNTRKKD